MAVRNVVLAIVAGASFGACHHVRLDPIPPAPVERLPLTARYDIEPLSTVYEFSMRSFAAGIANKWTIHVGEALSQYARAYLGEAFPPGDRLAISIAIERFEVDDFQARASVRFVVEDGAVERLNRVYLGTGNSYFKRTAMTGVFGMEGSMKKTTDEALRSVFEQFLADIRAQSNSWPAP